MRVFMQYCQVPQRGVGGRKASISLSLLLQGVAETRLFRQMPSLPPNPIQKPIQFRASHCSDGEYPSPADTAHPLTSRLARFGCWPSSKLRPTISSQNARHFLSRVQSGKTLMLMRHSPFPLSTTRFIAIRSWSIANRKNHDLDSFKSSLDLASICIYNQCDGQGVARSWTYQ